MFKLRTISAIYASCVIAITTALPAFAAVKDSRVQSLHESSLLILLAVDTFPWEGALYKRVATLGTPIYDQEVRTLVRDIGRHFHVDNVVLVFVQERSERFRNAFAYTLEANYIAMGVHLFAFEYHRNGIEAIAIIIAHEYVHLVQNQEQWKDDFRLLRDQELEADMIAAYILTWFYKDNPSALEPALKSVFESGDTNYCSADHHGNRYMRWHAAWTGIELARQDIRNRHYNRSLQTLHQYFLKYVLRFPPPICPCGRR